MSDNGDLPINHPLRPAVTYDPPIGGCACPPAWWGVVPPSRPVHNPASFGIVTVTGTGSGPWVTITTAPPFDPDAPVSVPSCRPVPDPPRLHPADLERIARRVAELLKEQP